MKILHISTYDGLYGAHRTAHRLHTALRRAGVDSWMYVLHKTKDDPYVVPFEPPQDLLSKLSRQVRSRQIADSFAKYARTKSPSSLIFRDDRSPFGASVLQQMPRADLITIHEVTGFVDFESLIPKVAELTPVVYSLHEMIPFTGGCQYDLSCAAFTRECGTCPQLGSTSQEDLSHHSWRRKAAGYRRMSPENLQVVANSKWLASQAERSSLLGRFPISTIYNAVESDDFAPRDKQFSRASLGIPDNAKVVLFVATQLNNPIKGFDLLQEALKKLCEQERLTNLFLLSVGTGFSNSDDQIPHTHLGFIQNDRFLSLAFSAADVFVIPSRAENLGQTIIESLACGTPVIGSQVGGIPETVRPGVTGLLFPPGDVAALCQAIVEMFENQQLRENIRANCRKIVLEEFSMERQSRLYRQLYERFLPASSSRTLEPVIANGVMQSS